jgi:hypothetical protein
VRSNCGRIAKALAAGWLGAGTLSGTAATQDVSVTPYRPTVSTPAALSAPGWLELEAGYQRIGAGTGTWRDSIPFTLKLAFSDDWGIRAGGELLVRTRDSAHQDDQGFGDTSVVLKRRFAVNDASALGLEVGAVFPTAPTGLHSGSGATDITVNGIYSADFGPALHADVNVGVAHLGTTQPGSSRDQVLWAIAVSRDLGSGWGMSGEASGTDQGGVSPSTQLLLATSYSPRKSIAWDFGVARARTAAVSSWSVLAGGTFLLTPVF